MKKLNHLVTLSAAKSLIIALLITLSLPKGYAQTGDVRARRVIADQAIQLRGTRIDTVTATDTSNWRYKLKTIPTASAVHKFVEGNKGWGINGTIGTNKSTHFIGTIDSVPFSMRVNNKRMFFISDTWDSIWSEGRGSVQDIFIGDGAGNINRNDTIKGAIAIGDSALAYLTPPPTKWAWGGPMAIGHYAAQHNTTGVVQAGGWQSLRFNTTGYRNVGWGPSTGRNNITGGYDTYVGHFAGEWASSKSGQSMFGANTGRAGGGENDAFFGSSSGYLSGGSIIGATMTSGGSGYTYATVTFSAPSPNGSKIPPGYNLSVTATGTAVISGGQVTGITMTEIGRCYSAAETYTVTITGDGSGATATPILDFSAYNAYFGTLSAWLNNVGKWNVGVGQQSAYYGNRDTGTTHLGALSYKLPTVTNVLKNATAVGYKSNTSQDNTVVLGDTTVRTQVGIGTTQPTAMVDIRSAAGYGFRMVDGYEADGRVLQSTSNGSGRWGNVRLSQLTAASALNDIDNGSYTQTLRWSAIESNRYGMGLRLSTPVLNAAPLRIEGYSNSWGANLLRIIDSNSAAGSGNNHTIIQTMSPLLPTGSIQNALAFGTDLSSYNSGYVAFVNTGTGLNTNRVSFSLHGVNEILTVVGTNRVGVAGITNPTAALDINGNKLRLRGTITPASSSEAGETGEIGWDANYIYIWIATNTVRRIPIPTETW